MAKKCDVHKFAALFLQTVCQQRGVFPPFTIQVSTASQHAVRATAQMSQNHGKGGTPNWMSNFRTFSNAAQDAKRFASPSADVAAAAKYGNLDFAR